jgi:hypothetical protein
MCVSNAYQSDLLRSADQTALNAWVPMMQQGMTQQYIESALLGSGEYCSKHGGTPTNWVSAMYQDVLHRAAAPAERQAWVNALSAGTSYFNAAYIMGASFEAGCARTQTLHTNILHRKAGSA